MAATRRSPATSSRTIRAKASRPRTTPRCASSTTTRRSTSACSPKTTEPGRIIVNDLKKDFNTDGERRLPDHPRHVPRRAQRLSVRDQSRRRQVGRADGQRGAREQRELGRHLGRGDAHHRDRLVRGDPDSLPDAEVQRRRFADLGHQLRAEAAAAERRQLLGAAAAHLRHPARVARRHARRHARRAAGQEPPGQAVRARAARTRSATATPTATSTPAST